MIKEKVLKKLQGASRFYETNTFSLGELQKAIDLTLAEVEKVIDGEIVKYQKVKEEIEEKYRNAEPTEENQDLRITSTLATLKGIKIRLTGDKLNG